MASMEKETAKVGAQPQFACATVAGTPCSMHAISLNMHSPCETV